MPNWCYNTIKVQGSKENTERFIRYFNEKGFESYIPIPEPLKRFNTETSSHYLLLEKFFKINYYELYSNDKCKELILLNLETLVIQNSISEEEKQLATEIIECLKTGYYSWYEFGIRNWSTKWNAWDIEVTCENTLNFVTAWSPPVNFLLYVSKIENLCFELRCVDITGGWAFEFLINNGEIISEKDITDEVFYKSN